MPWVLTYLSFKLIQVEINLKEVVLAKLVYGNSVEILVVRLQIAQSTLIPLLRMIASYIQCRDNPDIDNR